VFGRSVFLDKNNDYICKNSIMIIKHLLFPLAIASAILTGCSKEGTFKDSWYAEDLYSASYFESMDLSEEGKSYIFTSDGIFAPGYGEGGSYYDPETGLWELSQQRDPIYVDFIHIVDKNQLNYYESAVLAKDGSEITKGRDRVYSIKKVKAAGNMSFYGYPTIYFYEREGDFITITLGKETAKIKIEDQALLMNGGGRWPKFNHDELH
jgi:hypothetical protein